MLVYVPNGAPAPMPAIFGLNFSGNHAVHADPAIRLKELPFDQHLLISLIAPRPFYVSSAKDDRHSDPEGEFAAAKAAEPVYRLLGAGGLPAEAWPAVGTPVHGGIGYHVRAGKHDVLDYDWDQYLDFADRHLKTRR